MNIYAMIDGQRVGPLQVNELQPLGIRPDTMVWYDGLDDWKPAGEAPATAWLFESPMPRQQQRQPYRPTQIAPEDRPPHPNSYLVFSLIMLLCCCQVIGIITTILSVLCNNSYNEGNYDQSRSYSRWALWLNLFGLLAGVLFWVFYGFVSLLPILLAPFGI